MSLNELFILAILPVSLAGIMLVAFRFPARVVMPVALLSTALIAYFAWDIPWVMLLASSLQGLVITADILYIIFGAILLLNVIKYSGGFAMIQEGFASINPDRRVQVVIIVWLFGSFIEGAAGFGAPAAVVSPLLVALGFPAMAAVMLGMMVQSTAVTFGSAGTPILVGVTGGLESPLFDARLLESGIDMDTFLQLVTNQAVLLHAITGIFMPALMVIMMTRFFGKRRSWKEGLEFLPFAVIGGLAFTIPYFLTGWFLGPEFPSLFGAVGGMLVMIPLARRGILVPGTRWDFENKERWPDRWNGSHSQNEGTSPTTIKQNGSVLKVWYPYFLLAALLVISRLPQLPVKELLLEVSLEFNDILGTGLSASTAPLYLPGTAFIIAGVFALVILKTGKQNIVRSFSSSVRMLTGAAVVLIFTIPMVRIYINSGINPSGLSSMPVAMAEWMAIHVGQFYPFIAPDVGALGAFIAGSNTVSNLMFSLFQFGVAEKLSMPHTFMVALQATGAAAGNMIAIHNVVAACATVGLLGREGDVLRKTIFPTLYYLLVLGILGLVSVHILEISNSLLTE